MLKTTLLLHVGGWLDNKSYYHVYDLSDENWSEEDRELLMGSSFRVELKGDKCCGVYRLSLQFSGSFSSFCDRCANELTLKLADSFELLVKPVTGNLIELNAQEQDPYIWYIPLNERVLDISSWIYDSIILMVTKPKFCEQINRSCDLRFYKTVL